ncbi:hypothetical protein ZIOFF_063820 [Zingiber officinale]|uniref:Uncharacterized protein n=1 Tax=Zingiber officinale TaxID=94328 RepID=A0A8J5F2D9_ZINOF|nr:hypothetical protein ZIOFF_063820 [Zingiber officinale]
MQDRYVTLEDISFRRYVKGPFLFITPLFVSPSPAEIEMGDASLPPPPPPDRFLFGSPSLDESYRPLPSIYLAFLAIWAVAAFTWTVNTWRNRFFQVRSRFWHLQLRILVLRQCRVAKGQTNHLQWMLASVPVTKSLQLGFSFSFWNPISKWYSCINRQICSLWMSFGVYVTGILFQTASFVSFMLIAHGYCVIYERLSVRERRKTAALGFILYLTLVGYKAAVPYFTVEHLWKFQTAMQFVALVEVMIYLNVDETLDNYWFRLLVREWAQFCIFLYIGWTFRTQEVSPHFSVMPTSKSKWEMRVPPVYSIEMDASDFNNLVSQEWHVGVPTSSPYSNNRKSFNPLLVIVQNPRPPSKHPAAAFQRSNIRSSFSTTKCQHVEAQV